MRLCLAMGRRMAKAKGMEVGSTRQFQMLEKENCKSHRILCSAVYGAIAVRLRKGHTGFGLTAMSVQSLYCLACGSDHLLQEIELQDRDLHGLVVGNPFYNHTIYSREDREVNGRLESVDRFDRLENLTRVIVPRTTIPWIPDTRTP